MNVLFVLAGDETRASTRYRVLNLLPALDDTCITYDCVCATKFEDSLPGPNFIGYSVFMIELLFRARNYDVIFLQKVPLPPLYLDILKCVCNDIVYDFDDAIYTSPAWEDGASKWKPLVDQTLANSSLVITGSPVLSEYARKFCHNVVSQPTALPADKYEDYGENVSNETSDTITLGWIGNPQNLHYLTSIEEPLRTVLEQFDQAELLIITAGDLPVTPLHDRLDVTYKEWSLDSELDLLAEVDIGLRPLFNDPWTRGKGGYTSVIQKMALGIPVVVTPVGMLSEIVEPGSVGYHANTDEEWVEALTTLIRDQKLREEMGSRAHERIDELNFWSEQRAEEFANVLTELA